MNLKCREASEWNSPPWQRLGKGGVAAPSSKWPRSFEKRGAKREPGRAKHQERVVRSTSDNRWVERTTLPCFALSGSHSLRSCPSAPAKDASPLFLNGRSHPSFAKEGSSIRMLRDIY